MNITPQSVRPARTTPRGLRNALLILLIGSAATGLIFSVFSFYSGASAITTLIMHPSAKSLRSDYSRTRIRTDEWNRLFNQVEVNPNDNSSGRIVCQGMLIGENGGAVAAVNNQVAMPGSIINGALIRSISMSNIVVEYNGQTHRLGAGETLELSEE